MCLEFDFTYAVQISLRSVNSLSYYISIYMKTKIVIISKNKSEIKKYSRTKCTWNSILHILYKLYQDRWTNTWRHVTWKLSSKVFTGRNFEARTLRRFLHLWSYLYLHNSLTIFFSIRKFWASSVEFFKKVSIFLKFGFV